MNFLTRLFPKSVTAPVKAPVEPSFRVTFYMSGGQEIVMTGVKEITVSKTNAGGFASYSIIWHEGRKPALFSITLDHISAVHAEQE